MKLKWLKPEVEGPEGHTTEERSEEARGSPTLEERDWGDGGSSAARRSTGGAMGMGREWGGSRAGVLLEGPPTFSQRYLHMEACGRE